MTRNFYTLDGIPLHDPQGRWTLGDGAEIRSVPARRKSSYVIPGQDGEVPNISPSFDPGKLAFNLHILTNEDHDKAMKTLEFWNGVLGQRNRLLPLDHTYNGQTRRAMVQITASAEVTHFAMKMITISVICDIPGTFWRDVNYTVVEVPMSGTQVLSGLSGGTGPINDAIIKLRGPFSSVTIYDPTFPENTLKVTSAISAENEVVIDVNEWKAVSRRSNNLWDSDGLDLHRSLITAKGTGIMFPINPSLNYNTLSSNYSLNISASGTSTASKVLVRAKRSFL